MRHAPAISTSCHRLSVMLPVLSIVCHSNLGLSPLPVSSDGKRHVAVDEPRLSKKGRCRECDWRERVMQQERRKSLIFVSAVMVYFFGASGWWGGLAKAQSNSNDKGVIQGTVRDQQASLYGISVSAKGEGKNSTTFVFTNDRGEYAFPVLPADNYVISVGTKWQRAVKLGSSPVKVDFVVELGSGFLNQTSGARWINMLPGSAEGRKLLFT